MRNTFYEKSYTKCGGEIIIPRLFSKKSKLSISLDQQSKVLYSFIFLCPSQGLSKYIPQMKLFQKTKRGLELVSLPHFLHDF